ncbi:MAG: hypothetical protein LBG80_10105 [Bacteroidales bacterium]|jgi:hypothetical protein|nr:hypothetical protein [Bacteroidales bacterium]
MKKRIFLIITVYFSIVCVFSQSVSETRKIKTTAIEIYEKYTSIMANLYNGDVYNWDKFLSLFDENAIIYNDILPANKSQYLSPKEYFDVFTQNIKMSSFDYSNLNLQFPDLKEDKWKIKCTFTKYIRFTTQKDRYYPQWHFEYIVTIEMDTTYNQTYKIYNNAKIKSIEVTEPLKDFFIIQNKDSLPLIYYGSILGDFEGPNNSRLLPGEKPHNQITAANSNIFYSLDFQGPLDEYFYDVAMRKRNLIGLGINYGIINFGNNISKSNLEKFNDIKQNHNILSLSFLYGLQFAHKQKSTWFFNIRTELNWYNYIYTGTYYTQYQSIDADDDPYLRKIRINSLSERINNLSVSLPLSFQYLLYLPNKTKKQFFLSFEIGGFAEYILFLNHSYNFNADYSGYYAQYFSGVEFDHYYDYGNFEISDKNKLSSVKDLKYDYGAFGSIGLWLALNDNHLLKLDISYKHSFNVPLTYKEDYVISENYYTYESLLQSTKQGLQNIYIGISFIVALKTKQITK